MKQMIIILVVLLLNISCSKDNGDINNSHFTINSISNIDMNDSLYYLIKKYTDKYSQFNTFLLIPTSTLIHMKKKHNIQAGYLLGPAYEGIYEDKFPLFYIQIDKKKIFVKLNIEPLMKTPEFSNNSFSKEMISRGIDSLTLSSGWIVKNGDELFIHRAIYFSIDEKKWLSINERPDTIFAPQLKETIEFINMM
jgi:hypothetical protein